MLKRTSVYTLLVIFLTRKALATPWHTHVMCGGFSDQVMSAHLASMRVQLIIHLG